MKRTKEATMLKSFGIVVSAILLIGVVDATLSAGVNADGYTLAVSRVGGISGSNSDGFGNDRIYGTPINKCDILVELEKKLPDRDIQYRMDWITDGNLSRFRERYCPQIIPVITKIIPIPTPEIIPIPEIISTPIPEIVVDKEKINLWWLLLIPLLIALWYIRSR